MNIDIGTELRIYSIPGATHGSVIGMEADTLTGETIYKVKTPWPTVRVLNLSAAYVQRNAQEVEQ